MLIDRKGSFRRASHWKTLFAVIATIVLGAAGEARAQNRIDGYVTYSYAGRTAKAVNARVDIVNTATNRVAVLTYTDAQGYYNVPVGAGRYQAKATYAISGARLAGATCCANFARGSGGRARLNIQVR